MVIFLATSLVCIWISLFVLAVTLHVNDEHSGSRNYLEKFINRDDGKPSLRKVNDAKTVYQLMSTSMRQEQQQQQQQKHEVHTNSHLVNKPRQQSNHFKLSPPHDNMHNHQSTSSQPEWSWPIIHIVHTRFMQGQGTLVNLARSRLKLLEVICLPSIQKQSILNGDTLEMIYNHTKWGEEVGKLNGRMSSVDPNFLWIIKVDPNLDEAVLNELKLILEPVKQFTLVVGSNVNYGIGVKSGGWRDGKEGQEILDSFKDGRVSFPSDNNADAALQMIFRAHEARSDRVVLETRLDADDAINLEYFAVLHYTALKNLVDQRTSHFVANDDEFEQGDDDEVAETSQQTARWMYWCPHRHVQWSPSSDFYDPNDDPGILSIFESPSICVTPGLTLGFAVGTEEANVPRYEHTKIYWEITVNHNNEGKEVADEAEIDRHDCGLYPSSRCAVFVENPKVSAFRSRAMTSAGMHMMEEMGKPSMEIPATYEEMSHKLWNGLIEESFGIEPQKAKEASEFMMEIFVDTVRDNIRGQCTKGHSCKVSSLEKLQRTIDILEEEVGGLEIIR